MVKGEAVSKRLNENFEAFTRPSLLLSTLSVRLNDHGDRLATALGADRSNRRHREPQLVPEFLATGAGCAVILVPAQNLQTIERELAAVVASPIRSFRDRARIGQILGGDHYGWHGQRRQLIQDGPHARFVPNVSQRRRAQDHDDSSARNAVRPDLRAPILIQLGELQRRALVPMPRL